jgi:hypothetical protein
MTEWKIGVFRPLLHVPTEFVINFRGARMAAGLCGSFVYVDRDVTPDLHIDACPICVERAKKCPSQKSNPPNSDGWPTELRSMCSS